ncbi:hypothetical protein SCHPADRAFT_749964 [Schizopora paradoxa]|uniref:DUF6533 domain-containing protein n=1 Tax=Schizopora paradoxa TaxID=27342 RepID=A0A0H2R031_9AGAM|nr:hypothetical protein SCHPADRAFT_749964 [Schizopora paradoxa]
MDTFEKTIAAEAVWSFRFYQYAAVATIGVISYEYLITFEHELRYLWRRRATFGGTLLFLCRYLPFTAAIQIYAFVTTTNFDISHCLAVARAGSSLVYIQCLLTIVVLFTRSYAIWGGGRRIFVMLFIIWVGIAAGSSYAIFRFINGFFPIPLHTSRGCILIVGNNDVWIDLTISIFCETLSLGILLTKSVYYMRELGDIWGSGSRQSILQVMTEDGIVYFCFAIVITTTNLFIVRNVTANLRAFLLVMQGSLQTIMCSRLLFHTFVVAETSVVTSGGCAEFSKRTLPPMVMAPRQSYVTPTETVSTVHEHVLGCVGVSG